MLVWSGLVSLKTLQSGRRYMFLGAFVFGLLLTPDMFSQTLLALPMYLCTRRHDMAKIMLPEKTNMNAPAPLPQLTIKPRCWVYSFCAARGRERVPRHVCRLTSRIYSLRRHLDGRAAHVAQLEHSREQHGAVDRVVGRAIAAA